MPEGLRNAEPIFCRMMKEALKDQFMEATETPTWEHHTLIRILVNLPFVSSPVVYLCTFHRDKSVAWWSSDLSEARAEPSWTEIPHGNGDCTESHFCIGALVAMKDRAEGHRCTGGPRLRGHETVDMCHPTIHGAQKHLQIIKDWNDPLTV
jgi:hypothetical protein